MNILYLLQHGDLIIHYHALCSDLILHEHILSLFINSQALPS